MSEAILTHAVGEEPNCALCRTMSVTLRTTKEPLEDLPDEDF